MAQPSLTRLRQAARASQLYYGRRETMESIAAELKVSRSSVSRLLDLARQVGLVDIRLRSLDELTAQNQRVLDQRFQITSRIVSVSPTTSLVDRQDIVARHAARFLTRVMDSNMSLGVAWGSTTAAISRHIAPIETANSEVVQLNGAGNPTTTGIDYASEILRRFAESFGARLQQFPVPAFFDSAETRELMWKERSTRRVLDMQARLDIALFGVGAPFAKIPSHVYIGGYLDEADYRTLEIDGVVGDVATVFYRTDGSTEGIELNRRATGPDFSVLRAIPRRICVVSDRSKVPALLGALTAGLVTDLVIDDDSARGLLDAGSADSQSALSVRE